MLKSNQVKAEFTNMVHEWDTSLSPNRVWCVILTFFWRLGNLTWESNSLFWFSFLFYQKTNQIICPCHVLQALQTFQFEEALIGQVRLYSSLSHLQTASDDHLTKETGVKAQPQTSRLAPPQPSKCLCSPQWTAIVLMWLMLWYIFMRGCIENRQCRFNGLTTAFIFTANFYSAYYYAWTSKNVIVTCALTFQVKTLM